MAGAALGVPDTSLTAKAHALLLHRAALDAAAGKTWADPVGALGLVKPKPKPTTTIARDAAGALYAKPVPGPVAASPAIAATPAAVTAPTPFNPAVAFKQLPVAKQQQILRSHGYAVAVDGIAGPQTITAANAYLKGTPALVWNHAWNNSHQPAAATVAPAAAPAAGPGAGYVDTMNASASTTPPAAAPDGNATLLQTILGSMKAYKPLTHAELLQQARDITAAELAPQQASIASQEAIATANAQRDATFQAHLGEALANVLKSQGPAVGDAYHQAGNDEAAYAKGFSGDFAATGEKNANDVNAFLASLGAPAGQMLDPGKSRAASDVLYGLGGALPASALAREGAAFSSAADLLPQTATGRGAQLAADALRSGTDARTQLALKLSEIEAQRPQLLNSALTQLRGVDVQNQGLAQNNALLPLILAGKFDALPGNNPLTGTKTKTQTTLEIQADKASASRHLNEDRLRIAQQNADTASTRLILQAKIAARKALQKPGGMTQSQWRKLYSTADKKAEDFYYGVEAVHNAQGDVVTPQEPRVLYPQALERLIAIGVPTAKAAQLLNSYYLPGELGRPAAAPSHPWGIPAAGA